MSSLQGDQANVAMGCSYAACVGLLAKKNLHRQKAEISKSKKRG